MKKKIITIIFSIILLIAITFILIIFIKKLNMFNLEEKYYNNSEITEVDNEQLNELIEDEESFALFVYQPSCITSYEFSKILDEFIEERQISIYKVSFSEMRKTSLKDHIEYFPSFALFKEGKLIDFLESDKKRDLNKYKDLNKFSKWFDSYVKK